MAVSVASSRLSLSSSLHSASALHLASWPGAASDCTLALNSQFISSTQSTPPQQQELISHIKEQHQYQAPSAISISYDDRQFYDHASGLIPASDSVCTSSVQSASEQIQSSALRSASVLGLASVVRSPSDPLAFCYVGASHMRTAHSTQLPEQHQSIPTLEQQPQYQHQQDLQYSFQEPHPNNRFDNFQPHAESSSRVGNRNGEARFRYRINSDEHERSMYNLLVGSTFQTTSSSRNVRAMMLRYFQLRAFYQLRSYSMLRGHQVLRTKVLLRLYIFTVQRLLRLNSNSYIRLLYNNNSYSRISNNLYSCIFTNLLR